MSRNRFSRPSRFSTMVTSGVPPLSGFAMIPAPVHPVPLPAAQFVQDIYRLAYEQAEASVRLSRWRRSLLFGSDRRLWN
ncbi:MAG: hypothetical protein HUU20_03765 [Pirellulales bacterium]|nr:hypothetical protein [Pirellulales bacterium]